VESLVNALPKGCNVNQVTVVMPRRAGGMPSQSPLRAAIYLARAIVALGLALIRRWPTTLETPMELTEGNAS
jgi:hypothetical protein